MRMEERDGPGEMKSGPGLFSGQDGEFTLYDSKKGGLFQKKAEAEPAETSGEKTAQTSAAAGAAAARRQALRPARSSPPKRLPVPGITRSFRNSSSGKRKKPNSMNTRSGKNPPKVRLILKNSRNISSGRKPPRVHLITRNSRSISSGRRAPGVRLIIRNSWNGRNLKPIRSGKRASNENSRLIGISILGTRMNTDYQDIKSDKKPNICGNL